MATLFAITYPNEDLAKQAFASIDWSHFDHLINVEAACWITKEDDQVKVQERGHPIAGKALLGGALGLLVGGLFAVPVIGMAAGSALGAQRGKSKDSGIDEAFIASIGSQLESGGAAIVVLAEGAADKEKATRDLAQFGGTLHSTDLSPELLDHYQRMLDQGNRDAAPSASNDAS